MPRAWVRYLAVILVLTIVLHNARVAAAPRVAAPTPVMGVASGQATAPTDGADPPFPPPAAPQATDSRFVVTTGPGIGTHCLYRNEGPIQVVIPVARVVQHDKTGPSLSAMKTSGLIKDAVLTLPSWDVDYNYDVGNWTGSPERDRIYFNGHALAPQFLRGDHWQWHTNSYTIPIECVSSPQSETADCRLSRSLSGRDHAEIEVQRDADRRDPEGG